MTDEDRQELAEVAKAFVQSIVDELAGIRRALETAIAVPAPPAVAPGCQHPLEHRIDFGQTNGVADWQCGVPGCGFRSVPVDEVTSRG